jgi:hypothetical protein
MERNGESGVELASGKQAAALHRLRGLTGTGSAAVDGTTGRLIQTSKLRRQRKAAASLPHSKMEKQQD